MTVPKIRLHRLFFLAVILSFSITDVSSAYTYFTQGSNIVRWPANKASYVINTTGGPTGSLSTILASITTWNNVTSSSLVVSSLGSTAAACSPTSDGTNTICFGDPGGGLLGRAYNWWDADGKMIDSDIVMCATCWPTYDLEAVMTHELGHSIGLNHVTDPDATMYPTFSPGATKARTLLADDIAGAVFLYPYTLNTANQIFFSGIASGSSFSQSATISINSLAYTAYGLSSITISSITLGGTNMSEFSVYSDECSGKSFTAAGSNECFFGVRFSPLSAAAKNATLTVAFNAPDSTIIIPVYGNDATAIPTMNEWGLILLIVSLSLIALSYIKEPLAPRINS